MPLENLFPCFLTFLANIARSDPYSPFKFSCLFAFYSIFAKVIAFQAPKHYLIVITRKFDTRKCEVASVPYSPNVKYVAKYNVRFTNFITNDSQGTCFQYALCSHGVLV